MQRLLESSFPVYETAESAPVIADTVPASEVARLRKKIKVLANRHELERAKRRERDERADALHARLTEWRRSPLVRFARFLRMIPRNY